MKVSTFNLDFSRGHGIATTIANILRKVHEQRPDISLEVLCQQQNGLVEDGFPNDIPIHLLGQKKIAGKHFLGFLKDMLEYTPSEGEIMHTHYQPYSFGLIPKKGKRISTWYGNNFKCWDDPCFGPWRNRVRRVALMGSSTHSQRFLDHIVTISDYLCNKLVKKYHIPGEMVTRIHLGVDVSQFQASDQDDGYMLFVGRHVGYKNIKMLIDLSKAMDNYPLVCIGDGDEKEEFEDYARKMEVPAIFTGKIPLAKLIIYYQKCSFYVTASKWEGFGLPLIEAGACGKPVIAPNHTGHKEIIRDWGNNNNPTGLLYNNFEEMGLSALALINSSRMREDLGKAARQHVVEKFNLDRVAREYVEVYESLMD
ncbi:MAG: glycosyltransferase family 4 protein [Candidatus Woesearchaeota archaeon]